MLQVNPELKVGDVKRIFRKTADKIDAGRAGYDANGHSSTYGFGRVNACAAVHAAADDQGWAHCATDLRPWWVKWLMVLLVVLVVTLFLVSWMYFGLCHPVTWILGIATAFLVVLWIAPKLGSTLAKLRWWLAAGAASAGRSAHSGGVARYAPSPCSSTSWSVGSCSTAIGRSGLAEENTSNSVDTVCRCRPTRSSNGEPSAPNGT